MLEGAALAARELQLEHSSKLGGVRFHGHTMLPFLRDGDELVIAPVEWDAIRVGDIITYRLDDRFPTCRVVRRDRDKLVLRADARPDSYQVWREDVLGRVVSRTRDGRTVRATDWRWRAGTLAGLGRHRLSGGLSRVRGRARRARTRARKRWLRLKHGYRELPPAIQFNVARPCNLHCRMCPYLELHADESRARYMTVETFESLLPVVPLLDRVHFSGSGEPTFNKDLTHLMRMVRERHPNKQIHLTTNGTRLTESLARELIDLSVHEIHVSFDGANPETVRAIRRGVDYTRVLDNLRALDEQKRRLGKSHPIVMVNYMMGYGTYREILDFVRLAKEVGVRAVQLLEMQPACPEDVRDNLLTNLERDRGRTLREAVKLAESFGIQIRLPITQRNACYYPTIPHIGEDGEVYACCFLDYDGRQLYSEGRVVQMPGISFGNAARSGFKAVWESDAFVELRTRNARGNFTDYCRACYNARIDTSEKVRQVFGIA